MELLGESLILLGGILFFVGGVLFWKGRTQMLKGIKASFVKELEQTADLWDAPSKLKERDALIQQLVVSLQPFETWLRTVSEDLDPGSREKEEFEAVLKALDAAKEQGF